MQNSNTNETAKRGHTENMFRNTSRQHNILCLLKLGVTTIGDFAKRIYHSAILPSSCRHKGFFQLLPLLAISAKYFSSISTPRPGLGSGFI